MKILICNKYWYNRGGDCTYSIALEKMLRDHGHETAIFSMQYPDNFDTPWSRYFPSRVSFRNVRHPMDAVTRPFGCEEVKEKWSKILEDFQPDIVHLNNIHTQLSPVLAVMAKRRGIRVVWTLHDYKLICPRYDCRCRGQENCSACIEHPGEVIWNCCVKDSFLPSLLGYLELKKWDLNYMKRVTDIFLCPSEFMREMMHKAGVPDSQLAMIHNFRDISEMPPVNTQAREDYLFYGGRLTEEKGIRTLCKAVHYLGLKLKVAGDGELLDELRAKYASDKIEFYGRLPYQDVLSLASRAAFSVVPSEWYENNPLAIVESLCIGTPVIGAFIGGIPEMINDSNGMLFRSGVQHSLEAVLKMAMTQTYDYAGIAREARSQLDAEQYYNKLMKIYQPEA